MTRGLSFRRIVDFFGLRRSFVGLLGMVVLVGLGERIPERFEPEYVQLLGGGILAIGALNALTNLLGALYSFYGGYLSDRLGTKRALLAFNGIAMLGYLIVIIMPTWQALIIGSLFFLSWSAISLPATMGLVGRLLPVSKRAMGVSMHSLIRRIPMALGPLIGGTLLDRFGPQTGMRYAFLAALAMALVAVVLQQALIENDAAGAATASRRLRHPFAVARELSPALRNLLASDVLIRFCEQIPYAFVIIWCLNVVTRPVTATQFGLLTTVEMATAAVAYVPVAYLADRSTKKPFVLITFVFFTFFPLSLLFCHSFWPLVAAFVLRGLKEFGEATRKALILDLAPEDRRAMTFGVYYLVRDSIVSVAALSGAFLWMISPTANLLSAFGFGVIGTIWFALRGRDLGTHDGNGGENPHEQGQPDQAR